MTVCRMSLDLFLHQCPCHGITPQSIVVPVDSTILPATQAGHVLQLPLKVTLQT